MKTAVTRKVKKMRSNVHFFLPKTLIKRRDPKYPRRTKITPILLIVQGGWVTRQYS